MKKQGYFELILCAIHQDFIKTITLNGKECIDYLDYLLIKDLKW